MSKLRKKVAVAMSGGVDSSVSALLLQKKGYDVFGIFMRLGLPQNNAEDAARLVCAKLGIKFFPINIADKFEEVIDYYLEAYQSGITPNPCIKCNQKIKFGELLRRARELGADYLATGHYIKLRPGLTFLNFNFSRFKLFRGIDPSKDQSYFLYNLNQEILNHIIFPIGDYLKSDVKKIAEKNNLPNIKSESQDVCFLPGEHNDFLKNKIKLISGDIVDIAGKILGKHQGLPLYTIGQRKGIEIGGAGPYYVANLDYQSNVLTVTKDANDPILFKDRLIAKDVNWIAGTEPKFPFRCQAVFRYRHNPVDCKISKKKNINNTNELEVQFLEPQRAITSGQSVVFYSKKELLGGGVIV